LDHFAGSEIAFGTLGKPLVSHSSNNLSAQKKQLSHIPRQNKQLLPGAMPRAGGENW
jgi:hypothetical protein